MDPILHLKYEIWIPTLNEYIDAERVNKYKAANMKKVLTQKIKFWTMSQSRIKLHGLHDVVLIWTRKDRRHDADNVYAGIKFLLDGIVAAGTLPGDDRKHVRHISHEIHQGNKEWVEVLFFKV
jgi:hypothetical protein